MNINATTFIQIANFLVTYKVLNKLLFKPVIETLERKKKKKATLHESIKSVEEKVVSLKKEQKAKVVDFQNRVAKNYPFDSGVSLEPEKKISAGKPKKIETEKLEKEITSLLIEKVPHAY